MIENVEKSFMKILTLTNKEEAVLFKTENRESKQGCSTSCKTG